METANIKTLGVILSGGAGSRLNGVDKGLQSFDNSRLVEHVINALSRQTDALIICANRNIKTYESLGYSVIKDQNQTSYEGPLAGMNAAINWVQANERFSHVEQILIAPCDAPRLPSDYYQRLASAKSTIAYVHDGIRKQNLHCLISRSQWASLQVFFNTGGRAIHRWYSSVNATEVDFSDIPECFININKAEELLDQLSIKKA